MPAHVCPCYTLGRIALHCCTARALHFSCPRTACTLQVLLDLAAAGDEEKVRERIVFLKRAVEAGHTRANDRCAQHYTRVLLP